ncbi:hypothetical protein K503DRAFT_743210 [Rhizopogon vinicolor AM-OR11-026]|uniref:ABM domain-containing protein n=1 Tax=Rhizopogon vinicolor AM-OR11-026 TaxID=1314800 RepID=A0A1B7MX03_9AGAM|nr:hypothetical protein K503DRAFT_743210 [Rhizopogon vinicolor AM-OR11-026]
MPITEFASLSLMSPNKLSDPHVVDLFSKLSSWQASASGYPLCFFTNQHELREVYLVTGWNDVAAHEEWIKSARNQELLEIGGKFLDVIGMVHLDLDFSEFPVGAESLVCARSVGTDGQSEEAKPDNEVQVQGGWTRYGKDVQEISTGVYYFTESDALEDVVGKGNIDMKTSLKKVVFA